MFSSNPSSATWRHHVQDQEEDLVRELMQADDVDAVLARMEGDHYRHLSPIMRKLSSYDGSKAPPPSQRQQQQRHSSPPAPPAVKPSPAISGYASPQQHPPPPPPEPTDTHPYSERRRGSSNFDSRDGQSGLPSLAPQPAYRRDSSNYPPSASSSAYQDRAGSRYGGDVSGFSPAARPPPPPPPPPTYNEYDPLDAYRRPSAAKTTPVEAAPATASVSASTRGPFDSEAETRYNATIDSWLKPGHALPLGISRESPVSSTARPPLPLPTSSFDGPWASNAGYYHGNYSANDGVTGPAPTVSNSDGYEPQRSPRITTTTTATTGLSPPRPSGLRGGPIEVGELENTSQSRIARQLQLLRNYRELAELCSSTKNPSVDLLRSLPAEQLAWAQAEQLQSLPQREQSPITVNNNYYFDSVGGRRGSGGRSGTHSPSRSGRGRINSNDTISALSKTGAAPAGVGSVVGGHSRSVSELLTVDSRQGLTSRHLSGASSSQPLRPPLLPSPRAIPLQSPQPSSGPDSPVATPPLSQRSGAALETPLLPPPPLASPSPSRSYRARSHRSRHHDNYYTPTATTEEAGSSYEEDEEEDYAGDFLDNEEELDGDDYDDATAPRPPPPRIIEREQHRRVPNNNGNEDYTTNNAEPPLSTVSQQQQQQQQQLQHLQAQQQQQHEGYPSSYVAKPSGVATGEVSGGAAATSLPSNTRNGSSAMQPGAIGSNNMGGVPGSDTGRRSVSSAINVLSGDQELRANAQLAVSGMVSSRRGSLSQPPPQQQQQQQHIQDYSGNGSMPMSAPSHSTLQPQQQLLRSLSAGSSPQHHRRDGGALTDPGMASFSDPFSLTDVRRDGGGGGRRAGASTPEKHFSSASNGSGRDRTGGNAHCGSRVKNNRGVYTNTYRQGGRRGGRCRNYDDRRGEDDSDGVSDDLGPGSYDNDPSASEGSTPGNPQLQTNNPRSSAMRRRRQQQQGQQGRNGHAAPSPTNASGRRRQQRDGGDDDGTVHTPRAQNRAARQRASNRNARGHRQQGPPASRRDGRRGLDNNRNPSSFYFDNDDGVEENCSDSSYSSTASSDINDYVVGGYYSPIKSPARLWGRGNDNTMRNGGDGGHSPMRVRGRGNVSPASSSYRMSPQGRRGPYPAGGVGGTPRYNSSNNRPPYRRGPGEAAMPMNSGVRGAGRGRGGVNNMNPVGGGVPYPYYNSAAPYGRGRDGRTPFSSPQSANRRAPGSLVGNGGVDGNRQQGSSPFGRTPPRQQMQRPQKDPPTSAVGECLHNNNNNVPNGRKRSSGGAGELANLATGGGPVAGPSATALENAFVRLPNGITVPANSPAERQYRQMVQQQQLLMQMPWPASQQTNTTSQPSRQQQHKQPLGSSPSSGLNRAGGPVAGPSQPQISVAPSNVDGGRSGSTGGGGVRIHPGLLYGSLLPKARPKTALVVEDDDCDRERSVGPHGDATHEPFMGPGSVCPVQPVVASFLPTRTVFNPAPMDTFPVTSAIHGATANGVQPLAWKSGGSGCVMGRSGHLPAAPTTKLSSHYKAPSAQQPQQQRGGAVGVIGFHSSNRAPQQQQPQQRFEPLRQPIAGRRDSAYTLKSEVSSQLPSCFPAGVNNSQQRYTPLQEPLEQPCRSSEMANGNGRTARVVGPDTQRSRAAAERAANVQRFGIAPVQS